MKKIILSILTFIVALSSINLANCIGDINQVGNAKCITEYSNSTAVDQLDTITFGMYPQSDTSGNIKDPIEWIVLEKQSDKVLLLSKYILDCKSYNNELKNIFWENCDLREWLNNEFYDVAFDSNEKQVIINCLVKNNDVIINDYDMVTYIGDRVVSGGADCSDNVFCLSVDECKKYIDSTIASHNVLEHKVFGTRGTIYARNIYNYGNKLWVDSNNAWHNGNSMFWLRSPAGGTDISIELNSGSSYASIVHCDGCVDMVYSEITESLGVRPAIWVSLSNSSISHTNSDSLGEYIDFFGEKVYSGGEINRVNGKDAKVTRSAWEKLPPDLKVAFREDQIIDDVSNNVQETTKPAPKNGWDGDYYYQNDFGTNLSEQISRTRTYIEIKGNNNSRVNHDIESVTFGRYKYANSETLEPLEWVVLDKKDGKALLTTKYILLDKEFESVRRLANKSQEILAEGTTWGLSSLRKWLNSDFYNETFSNDERNLILTTKNKNESLYSADEDYDDTEDKIFLLSVEEGTIYSTMDGFNDFMEWKKDPWYSYGGNISLNVAPLNSGHRKTCKEGCTKDHPTWTRTMGKRYERYNGIDDICLRTYASVEGHKYGEVMADGKAGVRPAMWVKYDGQASSITIPDVSANSTSNVKSISNSNNVRKTQKQDVINSENNVADEVIDLDARNYVNKQEDIKESETKKQETIKQENRKTDETHKIPKYILDSWAKNDMSASGPDKFILSDDGYTIKYQITRGMLENSGVETELSVVVPGHEYDFISKTYPEVTFFVDYRKAWDDHKSEEYKIASKICDSYILSIDDGVNGKYDYDMLKRLGAGRIWFTQFMLPTTSKKEAKRIAEELNKKLDEDGFFTITIQYKETDKDMGEYAVNPIYIGKGKAVVKKEGFIFPKLSMYVEFEGEAKKLLEKYTKENKEKYLILTDGFIDDGTRATEGADIKYNDSFQDEINKIFSSDNVRENDDYNTKQLITKTISNGKVYVNMLGIEFMNKNSKIFTDIDVGYEYALKVAKVFPTDLYIVDRMEYYTK